MSKEWFVLRLSTLAVLETDGTFVPCDCMTNWEVTANCRFVLRMSKIPRIHGVGISGLTSPLYQNVWRYPAAIALVEHEKVFRSNFLVDETANRSHHRLD
jgi:hypothetical protein